MRSRAVLAAGIVVVVATGGVATAAKPKPKPVKPVCNIVSDPAGDSYTDLSIGLAPSKMPADPNGDILSADVSSDAKNLTAVVRVKSLASPDSAWPEAHLYAVSWNVPGHDTPVYLAGTIDPNPAASAYGPQFIFGDAGSQTTGVIDFTYFNIDSAAKVKGTVDTAKKTITMSVPISQLKGYGSFKPGSVFSGVNAQSQAVVNGPVLPQNVPPMGGSLGQSFQEDTAAGGNYVAGRLSCVKPGS